VCSSHNLRFSKANTSIAFKEIWHKADLEPDAQIHYLEMKQMTKKSLKFVHRDMASPETLLAFETMKWLGSHKEGKDIFKAVAKLTPFFNPEFLDSTHGETFKESLLLKQEERAKHLPDIRSFTGNQLRAKEFWKEWDRVKKLEAFEDAPEAEEWDIAIRPIIARRKSIPTTHYGA
jgi:hypothetical protein